MKTLDKIPSSYESLIIGGGIVGAGLLRDLSYHGIQTLLVDKSDFASKTSNWSSKMLHGGLRYLENYDFALVKEALYEKNLWLKLAPHLCYEEQFFLPVYQTSRHPLWMFRLGLFTYDLLSAFENSPHSILNRSKAINKFPILKDQGLKGGGFYCDAIVDDCKLVLENIYDSVIEDNAHALNYVEYISHTYSNKVFKVTLRDNLTNTQRVVDTKNLIFALGPYTDQVLSKVYKGFWTNKMLPSKGVHLWLEKTCLDLEGPMLLPLSDNRVLFVIPQKNSILVGTTETTPKNLEDTNVTDDEIQYIFNHLNCFFPENNFSKENIIGSYAGIRPLIKNDKTSLGKASREHHIYRPEKNVYIIAGGKLTTFRSMGQEIAQTIVGQFNGNYDPDKTKKPLRQISTILPFDTELVTNQDIDHILANELVRTKDDLIRRLGLFHQDHWPFKNPRAEIQLNRP